MDNKQPAGIMEGVILSPKDVIQYKVVMYNTVQHNKREWEEWLQQLMMAAQGLQGMPEMSSQENYAGLEQALNASMENKESGRVYHLKQGLENRAYAADSAKTGQNHINNYINLENIANTAKESRARAPYKSNNLEKFLQSHTKGKSEAKQQIPYQKVQNYANSHTPKQSYNQQNAKNREYAGQQLYQKNKQTEKDQGFARAPYKSNNLENFLEAKQNQAEKSNAYQRNTTAKQSYGPYSLERILPNESYNQQYAKNNRYDKANQLYQKNKQTANKSGVARAPYKDKNLEKIFSQAGENSRNKESKTGELYTNTAKRHNTDFQGKTQPTVIHPQYTSSYTNKQPNNYQATLSGGMKPGNNYVNNFMNNPKLSSLPNYAGKQGMLPKQDSGTAYSGMKGLPQGSGVTLNMPKGSYATAMAGGKK